MVFWDNPPFPLLVGSCLHCTPAFSGGEGGRKTLGRTWPCVDKHCLLAALEAWGWGPWSSSSGQCLLRVVSFLGSVCQCESESVPWSGARACLHDFLGATFCCLSVGMQGTDHVWLEFGAKGKKPKWRHRKQVQLEREEKGFPYSHFGKCTTFSLLGLHILTYFMLWNNNDFQCVNGMRKLAEKYFKNFPPNAIFTNPTKFSPVAFNFQKILPLFWSYFFSSSCLKQWILWVFVTSF